MLSKRMYKNKLAEGKKNRIVIFALKKARKERRNTEQVGHAERSEIVDLNPNISMITLNVNRLNSPHEGQRISA